MLPVSTRAQRDASESTGTWGIVERTRSAWLPNGRVVSFDDRPLLWSLLLTLDDETRSAESASKERLAKKVWDVSEYHPLRDDNRIQAAVRKLRLLLEDDVADPKRIRTVERGYLLCDSVRRSAKS